MGARDAAGKISRTSCERSEKSLLMVLTVAISAETVVLFATNAKTTLSAPLMSSTDENSTDGTSSLPSRSVKNGAAKVAEAEAEEDPEADLLVAREADRALDLGAVTEVALVIVRETALDRGTTNHETDRRIAKIPARDHDQRAPRETRALDRADDISRLLHPTFSSTVYSPA